MLFHLLFPLADQFGPFNLFRYLTFRSGGAMVTALLISFLTGPRVIAWLKSKQAEGQPIRLDGPEGHLLRKKGTPTMGGFLILMALIVSTLLWADLANGYVWVILFVTAGFGAVGFFDDYKKLTKRSTSGLSGRRKLLAQIAISGIAAILIAWLTRDAAIRTALAVPFFKNVLFEFGWVFFIAVAVFVITGASNAVNLTDGLDGLAIVPVMIAGATLGLIAYLAGSAIYSHYLLINHVPLAGDLLVVCGAMIGAGVGFLWFNAPPAQIFMGDTGSLALGGLLGAMAVAVKHEIVLAVIGGLFVMEALSVIVQVASFRLTGKRVFKMAPIHHHFEQLGWSEPQIVMRFWIIAFVLAMVGLASLKLR